MFSTERFFKRNLNIVLVIILYLEGFVHTYSQNQQLDELSFLYKEQFEKGEYQEAYNNSSRYISISEQIGVKENPYYSDALMVKALSILILDNNIEIFNILSNKSLNFEYEEDKYSEYYNDLLENRNSGFLFFLQRNLNDIENTNTCLQLINANRINIAHDSISVQLYEMSSNVSFFKDKLFSLYNQSIYNYNEDNYELSYKSAKELKNILEEKSLTDNSLYAECLQIIGLSSLLLKSDYDEFVNSLEAAINLEYELLGLKYYWYLQCYADGMKKYSKTLSFPDNLNLLKKAISLYEVLPYNDEPGYLQALSDLSVYFSEVNIEKSIILAEKALSLGRSTNSPDTITTHSNLCDYYMNNNQFDKALECANIVLNYRNKISDYDGLRIIYKRMASIFARKKDYNAAIVYAKKSFELTDKDSISLYSEILNRIGIYYAGANDYEQAKEYLVKSYKCEKSSSNSHNLAGVYAKLNNIDLCKYYIEEHRKFIIKDFWNTYEKLNEEDKFDFIHSQINYHQLYTPCEMFATWDYDSLANLAYECIVQNKILLNNTFEFEDISEFLNLCTFSKIKSKLNDNEIAIEFWSDRDSIGENTDYIYGYAIKNNWNNVRVIKLSKDKVYKTLRNEIPTSEDYLPLYEHIWKPILSKIDICEEDTIYLALDDILTQIPIEYICGYDWIYLGDKYNIRRVSDTSKIPSLKNSRVSTSAYIYGGAINSFVLGDTIRNEGIYESIDRKSIADFKKSFSYLPWSVVEADNARIYLENIMPATSISVFTENACSKASVMQLSGNSPNILHFATHGFNIPPRVYENLDGFDGHIFAMKHIGLVFSNNIIADDDFMLTAYEIAKLDLSNTDLVIMSSCNSGIGIFSSINISSELIYAFKNAGVQSIIATLSKIDDAPTSFFMKNFYKNLSLGMSKYESFKNAQNSLRESEEFSNFPYWAYFIMID